MVAKLVDGKAVAKDIRDNLKKQIDEFTNNYAITPKFAVIVVGQNPASKIYVKNKRLAALECGMMADVIELPDRSNYEEIKKCIHTLNRDKNTHGILVQLPLPDDINKDLLVQEIDPIKDVDGLHPISLGKLLQGNDTFVPATPGAIQQILRYIDYDVSGKHVVICGRSDIVGKPVAALLVQKGKGANATVTLCHSQTKNLEQITSQADVLIVAIGRPEFITENMVSGGTVVIDVGINRVSSPTLNKGYKLVGDVQFESVSKIVSAITPVPGGVGPVTVSMLLLNTYKAAMLQSTQF